MKDKPDLTLLHGVTNMLNAHGLPVYLTSNYLQCYSRLDYGYEMHAHSGNEPWYVSGENIALQCCNSIIGLFSFG